MSLRSDGAEALQWLDGYLERLRDLPVLAQGFPVLRREASTLS